MTIQAIHSQLNEILRHYFQDELWELEIRESGVNNTTRFVKYESDVFVLRLYDNHADVDKVQFELAVLEQLQHYPLSFRVPKPKKTMEGKAYTVLPSGKIAALFHYIEGERAELTRLSHAYSIGQAVGELVNSLAQVQVPQNSAYEPYYELDKIHPLVTPEKLNDWVACQLIGPYAKEARLFQEAIRQLEFNLSDLKRLPVQLVHSDIVGGNILACHDAITGILDFEFVTPDLRMMEAAVFLSELIRHHGARLELVEAFVKGYGGTTEVTEGEVGFLPQLILLRSLVLCIHFLGRQWAIDDKENKPEAFLASFGQVHAWMERNQSWLLELCREHWEVKNR